MKKTNQNRIQKPRNYPPARTPDEQEQQMIGLSMDLAEQWLRDGTAPAQVVTHFLKLGSTRNQKELERLEEENKLLRAKTESIQASQRTEELLLDAMKAFGIYKGEPNPDDDYDEY